MSRASKLTSDMFAQWDKDDDEAEAAQERHQQATLTLHATGLPELHKLIAQLPIPLPAQLQYTVRKPTEYELSLLYSWLSLDEEAYDDASSSRPNPAKYWSRAGLSGALHDAFSTPCKAQCKREARHVCNILLCAFSPHTLIPLSFAVLKEDAFTIDAIGTWSKNRGKGAAAAIVEHCMSEAKEAGETVYEVDSLITALTYWRKLGFEPVPARDIPKSKLAELEYHRPVRKNLMRLVGGIYKE